ncbi:MAG: hypothetical protein AVDCRST_MAG04-1904 [uncultured Acetobacteraceae bacterium]|uniref:Uncharacterized protein n=1 Tax=uncultured Acetobacteraceae bacterium TaxID=169975 RepID=A0A6J4IAN0_9PROT|nr:MAG: hypothetical protein AVDCRST_MAG04-1904 [uncultured Acetobacteraceae bacterium]
MPGSGVLPPEWFVEAEGYAVGPAPATLENGTGRSAAGVPPGSPRLPVVSNRLAAAGATVELARGGGGHLRH